MIADRKDEFKEVIFNKKVYFDLLCFQDKLYY